MHNRNVCDIRISQSSEVCDLEAGNICVKRNNGGMDERETVRLWLSENLEKRGHGARKLLADFLGVRTDAISRMTTKRPGRETRSISATELLRMTEFFGAPPPLGADGPIAILNNRHVVAVMGYIGAGAEIAPEHEQVPPDGLAQVELPFEVPEDMIGFEVRGDSQLPKFSDGDVIVVPREQRRSTGDLIGEEAAVRTYDGHRYLKRIMPGPRQHTYNLESANARTIVGARIEWASEIWVIVPASRLRHPTKAERARVALREPLRRG